MSRIQKFRAAFAFVSASPEIGLNLPPCYRTGAGYASNPWFTIISTATGFPSFIPG